MGLCHPLLAGGDTVIDGGNSHYKDTLRRAALCAAKHIEYVDAGTSSGIWGLEQGYSLMLGGAAQVIERLRPLFTTPAPAAESRRCPYLGTSADGGAARSID